MSFYCVKPLLHYFYKNDAVSDGENCGDKIHFAYLLF